MKSYRLNRLFNAKSNRCFDVAVDHGFFNERGFLQGIENLEKSVQTLVDAAPDAIQLTIGQAHYLQRFPASRSRRSCCAPTWRTSTARNCPARSSAA